MKFTGVLLSVSAVNVLFPLLFSLFTVAIAAVFVWLMVRTVGKTESAAGDGAESSKQLNMGALLLVALVIGLILRLIFVFVIRGFLSDVNVITDMFKQLASNGFGGSYYKNEGTAIFPLSYYIYSLFGAFANLFSLDANSVVMPFFVKFPLIISDLITAFVLYKLTKKYLNSVAAVIVAGFVCVFPVFVFASSVWGTQYSLLAMFLALSFYFLSSKNFIATIGCYGAAMLAHKDAIYLFPLFAVFVIYGLVKASIAVHKEKGITFKGVLNNPALRPVFTIPVSIVCMLIISYLISLPLMIGSFGAGFFTFIYRIYLAPVATFDLFGRNSLGIFNLFMRNGKGLSSRFPSIVFAVLFAVIITGIVLLVYLSKKNRANLVFLGGYILLTLATYFVGFTEFSLLAALIVLLISFLLIRDKRILMIFVALSLLVMINASAVMANAGYYNNLIDYYTSDAEEILTGASAAVTIVCSALAVVTHLYSTVVLLDISMSNKRKILPYGENANFAKAMADFFRIKNK